MQVSLTLQSISRKKSSKKFMESIGRRLGQKQKKGESRLSNRTRQKNKRADRKMESNDKLEIPNRGGGGGGGETSEESGLPSGQKTEEFKLREDFQSINYRRKEQDARNKTKRKETDPVEVASSSFEKPPPPSLNELTLSLPLQDLPRWRRLPTRRT